MVSADPRPEAEQSFGTKLDDALARYGSSARCWKHCDEKTLPFHWSGENNWLARSAGAARLAQNLRELINGAWKCHIVAHSHGMNLHHREKVSKRGTGKDGRWALA